MQTELSIKCNLNFRRQHYKAELEMKERPPKFVLLLQKNQENFSFRAPMCSWEEVCIRKVCGEIQTTSRDIVSEKIEKASLNLRLPQILILVFQVIAMLQRISALVAKVAGNWLFLNFRFARNRDFGQPWERPLFKRERTNGFFVWCLPYAIEPHEKIESFRNVLVDLVVRKKYMSFYAAKQLITKLNSLCVSRLQSKGRKKVPEFPSTSFVLNIFMTGTRNE